MSALRTRLLPLFTLVTSFHGCGSHERFDDRRVAEDDRSKASFESLSNKDFKGKKHYFGWGVAANGDPNSMHNEVKFDVLHTHDIFTQRWGGGYIGNKIIGQVSAKNVRDQWAALNERLSAEDMYVQYSSGHGFDKGLAIGITYEEIANQILKMKAKEVIVFIMACYSGGLINQLNARKSEWEKWRSEGRTLFVMASSPAHQTSSTGPGTDRDEPNNQNGSAGSAFGHALWKALIGYADGSIDGVKDGYISLEEIISYTTKRTQEIGGHKPVFTGVYTPSLIINRVPPKAYVSSLIHSSEGISDGEVRKLIHALDSEYDAQRLPL